MVQVVITAAAPVLRESAPEARVAREVLLLSEPLTPQNARTIYFELTLERITEWS